MAIKNVFASLVFTNLLLLKLLAIVNMRLLSSKDISGLDGRTRASKPHFGK